MKELAEKPLLGRPIFIREVSIDIPYASGRSLMFTVRRIVRLNPDSEPLLFPVRWAWRSLRVVALVAVITRSVVLELLPHLALAISSMLVM